MSKFVERAGVGAMALMLGYALFSVSTLSIKAVTAVPAVKAEAEVEVALPHAAPAPAASSAPQVSEVASAVDLHAGEKVYAKCKSCHALAAGKNGVGPSLHGVVNRALGSVEGYRYSDAMKARAAETWTPELLDRYLADVKGTVAGTKMSFAGLAKAEDRANVIAFLAQQADTPIPVADLGLGGAGTAPETPAADAGADEAPTVVTYADPPPPTDEQLARDSGAVEALKASLGKLDYERARHHRLHNKPFIDSASNGECLVCHQEVLETPLRTASPAGVAAQSSLAWYQTLATYDGPQMNVHQRHMTSPYAQAVMTLSCNFCHQGNDLREESPVFVAAPADIASSNGSVPFTNRKMVNPSETCLKCHGAFPDPVNIMGLPGPWHEARKDLESPDAPNGCLTCHAELFRTNRHKVTYLNAATIEDLATESSDVCFGCHGGRAWYRTSYPYPRHPWPGMDTEVPEWARDRKATSDPRYAIQDAAQ